MGLQAKDCQKPPEGGERQGMDPEVQTTGTCFELLNPKLLNFCCFPSLWWSLMTVIGDLPIGETGVL